MTAAWEDEREIVALTVRYCWAIDEHRFEVLREVFVPDATATLGRALAGVEQIMARCAEALTPLDTSQHLVANHQVSVEGDTASCRCYFHAQHVRHAAADGAASANFVVAGRYVDDLVRTPAGWRIRHRELVPMWTEGNQRVVRPG